MAIGAEKELERQGIKDDRDEIDFIYSMDETSPVINEQKYERVWQRIKERPYLSTTDLSEILLELGYPGLIIQEPGVTENMIRWRVECIRRKTLIHAEVSKILNYAGDRKHSYGYWSKYWSLTLLMRTLEAISKKLKMGKSPHASAILLKSFVEACGTAGKFIRIAKPRDEDTNANESIKTEKADIKKQLAALLGEEESGHEEY